MFLHPIHDVHKSERPSPSRAWVTAILALTACLVLQVSGCRANRLEAPPRLPQPAMPAAAPVARFKSTTVAELREAVHKMFGEGPFRSGQTLDDTPAAGAVDFTEDLPANLGLAFTQAGLKDATSPVIAHEAGSGALRFIQLGPEGDDKISLVAGRSSGKDDVPSDKAFRVEGRWVQRLVEWDTCTRTVAEDTPPVTPCGYEGCPIVLTRQQFVHPSGERELLLFEISNGEPEAVLKKHSDVHVRTSKHCTATKGADGKCSLDCGQTAN